ncbi:hypothetical protein MWH28_12205 [Natroniella sulfidigena]|uniref:hypothetical protein n=1 Tax=Natroniella sulfidigena TaxID=723921 RepID=UPI00200AAB6A|nr:hypothetical protein [Natroniella sulfidigena]MCK8818119.1 hypothetical protein [Natroniella sulfidigena]
MSDKFYYKNWFVVLMLFLFFPVGLFLMWKGQKFSKKARIGITLLIFSMGVIGSFTEEDVSTDSNQLAQEQEEVEQEVEEEEPKEYTFDEYVQVFVERKLGRTTNTGNARYLGHSFSDSDGVLEIKLRASENLTSNMTRGGIKLDTKDVFSEFFTEFSEVDDLVLSWKMKLVDQRGNESLSRVLLISNTRENNQTINWGNVITDNIPNIVDSYWVHPAIR